MQTLNKKLAQETGGRLIPCFKKLTTRIVLSNSQQLIHQYFPEQPKLYTLSGNEFTNVLYQGPRTSNNDGAGSYDTARIRNKPLDAKQRDCLVYSTVNVCHLPFTQHILVLLSVV